MPKGEDITTKYKVDISDLKKNITEANALIKESNSVFNKSVAGLDNWSNSASGLSAKIKQLQSALEAQVSKLTAYQKQLETAQKYEQEASKSVLTLKEALAKAKTEYDENSEEVKKLEKQLSEAEKTETSMKKQVENLTITVNNQEATVEKTKKEIGNYEKALESAKKEEEQLKTATANLTKTIGEQQKELNELKSRYQDVVLQQGKNSDEAKELAKEIEKLSRELKDNKTKLDDTSKSADELDKSLENIDPKESANGFTILKGALASLVADGIKAVGNALKDFATDSITSNNKFQAATGASAEEMRDFKKEMDELYNNAYGESLQEIGDRMAYVKQATGEIDASKVKELTENAMALEDTFGSDFNETIRGVSNLMEHFGIDSTTAFDLFAKGSQLGLDYTGELGDNVAEYAGNFQQAGYTADEYFQLLVNGSQGGAYNLDKVNDSINEVKNRIGDGTIKDNIDIFSDGTKTAFENWENGSGTMKDVIDSIVNDIGSATSEQDALNMAATAFGTMGEDANLKVVESLTTTGDAFKDVKGSMEEVKDVRYNDLGTSLTELGRTLKSELLSPIVDKIEPVVKNFIQWCLEHMPIVSPIITGLATAFGVLASTLAIQGIINGVSKAMSFLNTTMLANPMVLIIATVAGLVVAFITLWNKSEAFRNFWIGLWEKIKEACSTAWEAIKGFFSSALESVQGAWGTICEFFSGIWEGIKNTFSEVGTWFNEKFTEAKEGITNLFSTLSQWFSDNVVEPIKNFFSPLLEWFTQLFQSIWDFIASVFKVIAELAQGCWNAIILIWGVVSGWFDEHIVQPLTRFFTDLWNAIKEKAGNAWNQIKEIWNVVSGWFNEKIIDPVKNFFSDLWSTVKEKASDAWNGVKDVWNIVSSWFNDNIVNPIKNKFSEMWNNLKTGASNAWEGIKTVFSSVANFFRDTFRNAWQKVKDVFSTGGQIFDGIKEGIVSAFKNIVNGIIRGINKVIEIPFNGINTALDKIRNVSIAGAQPFAGLVSRISVPQIPELERGTVLKKGQVGLLEGNGAEAVVPLERNKYWIAKVADELKGQLFDLSGSFASSSNSNTNSNTNNFTQIINAPKQPSRLELYRQTKNLLAYKGG